MVANNTKNKYNELDEVLQRFQNFMASNNLEELREACEGDERFMFGFDAANDYINDDDRIVTYDRDKLIEWEKRQFWNDGIAEGKKEGLAKGREAEKKEMIQNMYKNHATIDDIVRLTNIPEAKVRELLN